MQTRRTVDDLYGFVLFTIYPTTILLSDGIRNDTNVPSRLPNC